MFDLVINDEHTDRDLLIRLLKGLHAMALNLQTLQSAIGDNAVAVARNTAAVDALVASHSDPAAQVALDAAAATLVANNVALNADSAKAEAAVAPPVG